MLVQDSFVLLVVPLSGFPQFIDFLVNTAGVIVADDLSQLIYFLDGLQ
jgi:hypothetical protein